MNKFENERRHVNGGVTKTLFRSAHLVFSINSIAARKQITKFFSAAGIPLLAGLITAGPAHAVATNCPAAAQGIYNVCAYATAGAGTPASPWTGWESALNNPTTVPAEVEIYFPTGVYQQSTTVNLKTGWTLRGAGMHNSLITAASSFTSGAMFKLSAATNTSTNIHLRIEDLYLVTNYLTSATSGMDLVGGTSINIKRVVFYGFAVGIWLDQSELADIEECEFDSASNGIAGIYLVNGPYHTSGADPGYTNRIGIRKNEFNGSGVANYVAVYDEGGVAHMIRDNNFQGGAHAIRAAAARDLLIEGNEIEGTSAEPIAINLTTPNESWTDSSLNVAIRHNTMATPDNYSSIIFPTASGGNAVLGVTISDNLMNTKSGGPASIAGINNVLNLVAYANNNFASNLVPMSDIGAGAFQVLGNMTISTTNALGGTPATPPSKTFYIYVDSADNKLKAKGSGGTITVLATP